MMNQEKKFEKSKIRNLKKMVKKVQQVNIIEKEKLNLRTSWVLKEEQMRYDLNRKRQEEMKELLS